MDENTLSRRTALSLLCLGSSQFALAGKSNDLLAYPLPEALKPGKSWKHRRTAILDLFASDVYGETPAHRVRVQYQIDSVDRAALGGMAIRKQITIHCGTSSDNPRIHVLFYVPAKARKPVPIIVGLSFAGNHTVATDPGIALHDVWGRDPATPAVRGAKVKLVRQKATEESLGQFAPQWQTGKILSHGFGLAVAYYGDVEPDFDGGRAFGVRSLYSPDQTWGALDAWAWGFSRIADYLEKDHDADAKKLMLFGHSRIGKAGLWAAAQDRRFALTISNESGVGGASLYRANAGETIEHLNTAFPHWFCNKFHEYTGRPEKVPVDGNLLLSLIAPRPLYVASAQEDGSSNPEAEFYSAYLAGKVYSKLGKKGLPSDVMPPVDTPVMEDVAYHMRRGKHDVTAFDWDQYLKFAAKQFQS